MHRGWLWFVLCAAPPAASAEAVRYTLDPEHTFASFEADHLGISTWRGKFERSRGTVVLDRAARRGTVEAEVETASVAFGLAAMDEKARSAELFDAARFPVARFRAQLTGFVDGAPTQAVGTLELHGVTQPLTLQIRSLRCIPHPLHQRELCGADLAGTLQRDAFGIDAGKDYGFDMAVPLQVQVEALRDADDAAP
jgi:polyisoprenoid-binding protein YceI